MSVQAIKFAVAMTFALVSVYLGSGVGEGPIPIVMSLAAVCVAVAEMRMFDRLSIGSRKFKLSDLYSSALSGVRRVVHGRNLDVIETPGRFVAIGGFEVVDVWNTFEVLREQDVVNLSRLHGELIAIEGVEIQIEVAKRGRNPRIRYYVLASGKTPAAAVHKARTALQELRKGLRSVQIAIRPLRCDGRSCEITRIGRAGGSLPCSKAVFSAQLSMALGAVLASLAAAPNAIWLVSCLAVPSLMAGLYGIFASSSLSRGSGWAPRNVDGPAEFEAGRLRVMGSLNSFAALKRIEHYDRYLSPQDIHQLVSELNELLYSCLLYTSPSPRDRG